MRRFRCPRCELVQDALAVEAGHKCPMNHNRWTSFVHEEKEACE